MLATIIDSVIILLLMGSITYGYTVSRKVHKLMGVLHDLEPLVEEFSIAVDKSETSVTKMRENIDIAEQPQARAPAPSESEEAAFSSRRAAPEVPGLRVVRDKQEMVRAFFENSGTARV